MSLQQVLQVVRLHHVFWQNESRRAPDEERKDCEFFREQCQEEVAVLELKVDAAAKHRARNGLPHKPSERSLSTTRPATTTIRRRSMDR